MDSEADLSIRRPTMLLVGALLLAGLVWAAGALADRHPAISGEPRVGEMLTASESAVYKWQRCNPEAHTCEGGQGNNPNGWTDIDGAQGPGARTYTLTGADLGRLIRVLTKDTNTGTQFHPSAPVGPVLPAGPTDPPPTEGTPPDPTPAGPSQVPPPTFQENGNLDPIDGQVWVGPPGSSSAMRIETLTQVPHGSRVDVGEGRATLISQVRPNGRLQEIELWAGAFVFLQRPKRAMTVLRLIDPFGGPSGSAAATRRAGGEARVARRRKAGRRLWGRGKCRCRHRGRNSSGTARGTFWLTAERRNGTLTKVREGKVLVRERAGKRRVLVRAGEQYLARSR